MLYTKDNGHESSKTTKIHTSITIKGFDRIKKSVGLFGYLKYFYICEQKNNKNYDHITAIMVVI